ncbi:MAG: VOC family protein [Ilumatobacteraceae bacterium]
MGRWLDTHGPSVHHLAYLVDDVEAHARELVGQGLERIDLGPDAGAAFFSPRTTMGILTELVDVRTMERLHSGTATPMGPQDAAKALAEFRAAHDLA